MSYAVDDVVQKYVQIREEKRALEKQHEEALKPIQEKLDKIENWLLAKMNEVGVDSFKTGNGTAYRSIKTSCSMADQAMFKEFVFRPVIDNLKQRGVFFTEAEILALPLWNLVDFRSLKKGVEEYIEDHKQVPPGLTVVQTTTVNVRSK